MGSVRHTKRQRALFLEKFTEFGRVDKAAESVGISRTTHYIWMKDPKYRKQFEAARDETIQMLADEAHRRAFEGVEMPVLYKGDPVYIDEKRLVERTYSDSLLIFLLRAGDPKRYRDNASIEHTGKDGAPLLDIASVRAYMRQAPADGE